MNPKYHIIGLTGPMGSGKSVIARHLEQGNAHPRVLRARFAAPIKSMLRSIGLRVEDVDGDRKEEPHPLLQNKTPRLAMQTLGTEWGRNTIGENIWCGILFHSLDATCNEGDVVVIDDVRFPNEVQAIKSRGGILWHIKRTWVQPEMKGSDLQDAQRKQHESETHAQKLDYDICIVNHSNLDYLKTTAQKELVRQLGKWQRDLHQM